MTTAQQTAMICVCGGRHRPGSNYYVSVVDGSRWRPIVGPFPTHGQALATVEPARDKANELDPRAAFYAFGTVAMAATYTKPGRLNEYLDGLEG